MANNVATLNGVAITDIDKVNGITDANLQALNGEEFAGYGGITWSTDDAMPVALSGGIHMGIIGAEAVSNSNDAGATGALATYEHNGSSWSTGGSCSIVHGAGAGGGSESAGVIFGGWNGSDDGVGTEEYNGSSFSTVNNMVGGFAYGTGGGTLQTGQLATGGSTYNPTVRDIKLTQTYDGTNWANESIDSSGNGSSSAGESGGGGLDAFLSAGGALDAGTNANCQLFNQTAGSWTTKATCITVARYTGSCSDGTRVYKLGGYAASAPHQLAVCESWVENSWSAEASLPGARIQPGQGSGGAASAGGASTVGGNSGSAKTTSYFISALA
jgi:hypothetical protein|tara:strand:- start:186 stop:1172 length:987 start_codon:yes stop_codon:yes gene_type:complete